MATRSQSKLISVVWQKDKELAWFPGPTQLSSLAVRKSDLSCNRKRRAGLGMRLTKSSIALQEVLKLTPEHFCGNGCPMNLHCTLCFTRLKFSKADTSRQNVLAGFLHKFKYANSTFSHNQVPLDLEISSKEETYGMKHITRQTNTAQSLRRG